MAEYASIKVRRISKPIIEILAGIPTVVYGFFAALTVGPFFRQVGENLGLTVSSESALAKALSDETVNPKFSPTCLKKGPTVNAAKKP